MTELQAAIKSLASIARDLKTTSIAMPEEAYAAILAKFPKVLEDKRETFIALYLDGRRRLIKAHMVSIGTLTANLVHPREVFAPALICGAASIVVAHNHPSGDPTPSSDDRLLTERLHQGGRLLGINLDDHIVFGTEGYVSMRQLGILVC